MTSGLHRISIGRAFGNLLPEIEHDDPVGDPHDELHVMLDQQNGDPPSLILPIRCFISWVSVSLRPAEGSSRRRSFGPAARAMPISRSRCSP